MKENSIKHLEVCQRAERYKWIAIIVHCCTLYILYAKEFFTFSSGIVSQFNEKYMRFLYSDSAYSIGNGKLTLIQFYNFLVESTNEGVLQDSGGGTEIMQTMNDFFYKVIAFCFFIAIIELVLLFIGKGADVVNIIYIVSVFALVSFDFLWCHKFSSWGEGLGGSALGLSAWPFLCLLLAVVTSAFLNEREKVLKTVKSTGDEESSFEDMGNSYVPAKNSWTEYYQQNKSVIVIAVLVLLLELIAYKEMPAVRYNETGIIIWKLAEAFLIGMSVIYAASDSFRFLGLLALISVGGSMLIYSGNLWYFTWQIWILNIFHIALIDCLIWLEGKVVKDKSTRIYTMLCTAWIMAVPFYQSLSWGSIHMNFGMRTICETIGMAFPVFSFIKNKTAFMRIFHIGDEKVRNCVCQKKKIKICPACGRVQNKTGKYCGFCGCLLEEQDRKM